MTVKKEEVVKEVTVAEKQPNGDKKKRQTTKDVIRAKQVEENGEPAFKEGKGKKPLSREERGVLFDRITEARGSNEPSGEISKAVPGVVEKQEGSVVIVAGVRMEPVQKGLTALDGSYYYSEGVEVCVPFELRYAPQYRIEAQPGFEDDFFGPNSTYQSPAVDVYVLTELGHKLVLFVDDKSSVSFTAVRDIASWYHSDSPSTSAVLFINSVSRDDSFVGMRNAMVNVDSNDNLLNESQLVASFDRQGRRMPWETGTKDPFRNNSARHRFFGTRFKQCTVVNSLVDEGDYIRCRIEQSTLRNGHKRAKVVGGTISRTSLEGAYINVRNNNIINSTIRSDTDLIIKDHSNTIENVQWNFSGIFLKNKFGYMEIDVVAQRSQTVEMMRTSEKEIELSVGMKSEKLNIASDIYRLDNVIRSLLGYEDQTSRPMGFGFSSMQCQAPESIEASIVRYVGDTVRSRVGMFELLDQVTRNAKLINRPEYHYENMHAVGK